MRPAHRLSIAALSTAVLAASTTIAASAKPAHLAQGTATDLGVMSINLKDIVKPQVGAQGQTQAAGTPNEAGIGGFLPLVVGNNSIFFVDVLAAAALSTLRWLAPPSPHHLALATAGLTATAAGCMASMRAMTLAR